MAPRTFHRGSVLRARDLNALRESAQALRSIAGIGVSVAQSPGGIVIGAQPETESPSYAVRAELISEAACTRFAVVEFAGAHEGGQGPTLLKCRRPIASGFSRVGVALQGAMQHHVVRTQFAGYCPVCYDSASLPDGVDLAEGHRLGCRQDSYYAQWDQLGPLKVRGTLGEIDGNGIGMAVVEITPQRGTLCVINITGGALCGPYHTLLFGTEYVVDLTGEPGAAYVEEAT